MSSNRFASNASVLNKYLSLPQTEDQIQVEYVWNDSNDDIVRSKTITVGLIPEKPEDVPTTPLGMPLLLPTGAYSTIEYVLKPVRLYKDPFRRGNNVLALCEVMKFDGEPCSFNTRASCVRVMEQASKHEPWFGIEQEYVLMDPENRGSWPYGWPKDGYPEGGDYFYLGRVGPIVVAGRDVCEAHYRASQYAGVHIYGCIAEGMLSQWEYQVGPEPGIRTADDLWMSRFILQRVAEDFGIGVSFNPKVVPKDGFSGSGLHTNYSTYETRDKETGMEAITKLIEKLRLTHDKDIVKYDLKNGPDNSSRLLGGMCSSSRDKFTVSTGLRNTSVRIPQKVATEGYGYIEDRRPAANADPYVIMQSIVESTLL